MNLEVDAEITRIYKNKIKPIKKEADSKKNCETIKSIIGLADGCDEIKSAVLSAIEKNNIYSANILFRSLIEHYAKFLIMSYRFSKENNNNVGVDNLRYAKAFEIKSYGNALKFSLNLQGKDSSQIDYSKAINKIGEDVANKSSGELKTAAEQFSYRNVLKLFKNKESQLTKEQIEIFAPMALEYSELSTFVHGGPEANENGPDMSCKYKARLLKNTIMLTAQVYSSTYLCLSRDFPQTLPYFSEINAVVNLGGA